MKNGYMRLLLDVHSDCSKGMDCFNPNGCDKKKRCFHSYCDTFKFALNTIDSYSKKLGTDSENMINSLEHNRNCWYLDYYTKENFINAEELIVFNDVYDYFRTVGTPKYRCPKCGEETNNPKRCFKCNCRAKDKNIRYHGTVTLAFKDTLRIEKIFIPVDWIK